MATIELSPDDLKELLEEQIEFLKASCKSFDAGFSGEAKRLAVSVRVLIHDTANSTSLLKHLQKKEVQFLDSALPYNTDNILSHSSLVEFHMTTNGNVARAPLDSGLPTRNIPFEEWWDGVVFVDRNKTEFSRKDIVLTLANKEGGAHVDHKIDADYHALRYKNSLGIHSLTSDGKMIDGDDQVPATMRQIAHEMLKTLDPAYICKQVVEGSQVIIRGMSMGAYTPELGVPQNLRKNRPKIDGKKIGRNDPCSCGSGKKYKQCCL